MSAMCRLGAWAAATILLQACGGSSSSSSSALEVTSSAVCAAHAAAYAEVLATDARVCDPAAVAPCSARRPLVVYTVPNGALVDGTPPPQFATALSECPFAGTGVAVNPGRTAALDRILADYVAAGCGLEAGPGCGLVAGSPLGGAPPPPRQPECAARDPVPLCY